MTQPIAAQLAAAILGIGVLESDRAHVAEQDQEAEAMNEVLRELEARKMHQTISSLKYAAAALGPVVKAAAMEASAQLDKTSMPIASSIIGAGRALKQGFGGAAQAAGRLMPQMSTKTKLIGGAALAGTAYAGLKGLQAGRDYMRAQPHGNYGKGPAVMKNVNEFGYGEY